MAINKILFILNYVLNIFKIDLDGLQNRFKPGSNTNL